MGPSRPPPALKVGNSGQPRGNQLSLLPQPQGCSANGAKCSPLASLFLLVPPTHHQGA